MTPRGIRNKNPLNIRHGQAWQGLSLQQDDPQFCTFQTLFHGFRAGAKILRTYRNRYRLTTLRDVITRFAPPSENDTEAYIAFVAKEANLAPSASIWTKPFEVLRAMTIMECGTWRQEWEIPLRNALLNVCKE